MSPSQRILVAIDDTDASWRAVAQAGRAHDDDPGSTIRLFHVVGPIPTELLEFGGASDPAEEERLDRELDEAQARWFADERGKAQPLFLRAEKELEALGVEPNAISMHCCESIPEDNLPQLVLDDARRERCDTIVVGRNAYPWLKEVFHRHLGSALQLHADGIDVVVVD